MFKKLVGGGMRCEGTARTARGRLAAAFRAMFAVAALGAVSTARAFEVSAVYALDSPATYTAAGQTILIVVEFDENVTVTPSGTGAWPTLNLSMLPASPQAQATYLDHFASAVVFQYTVRAGDYTPDLN
jgi:hypothetical protein